MRYRKVSSGFVADVMATAREMQVYKSDGVVGVNLVLINKLWENYSYGYEMMSLNQFKAKLLAAWKERSPPVPLCIANVLEPELMKDAGASAIKDGKQEFNALDIGPKQVTAPTPAPASLSIESRIADACEKVAGGFNKRALLSDVRAALPGVEKSVFDSTVLKMIRTPGVSLVELDNRREITPTIKAAAIDIGGEPRHILWITKAGADAVVKTEAKPAKAKPLTVPAMVKQLTEWRDAYHNGEALVPDATFDAMEDALRAKSPDNSYFKLVGAPVAKNASARKVKLPFPMGSLPKIKADGSADKWLASAASPITITPKLDGVSCMAYLDPATKAIRLFTRGNGSVGQDLSHLIPALGKEIGKLTKPKQAIRGELILTASAFAAMLKADPTLKNARNTLAGIISSKGVHKNASKVRFLIHGQINPKAKQAQALTALKAQHWDAVPFQTLPKAKLSEAALVTLLAKMRSASKFDMDGLVLTDAEGDQIAFKGEDARSAFVVDHIDWKPSKHGLLKPVATFVKPVMLDGVMVKQATANNAKWVEERKLGPGAEVELVRSNSVIPKIVNVLKPATASGLPPAGTWTWHGREAKIKKDAKGKSAHDAKVGAKQLEHAFKTLGIEGFKATKLEQAASNGYGMAKLLKAGIEELKVVSGLGPANLRALATALLKIRSEGVDRVTSLIISGAFPAGWGKRVFTALLKAVPYSALDGRDLSAIKGFGKVKATQFADDFPAYKKFLKDSGLKVIDAKPVKGGGRLKGVVVVFTGERDSALEKFIEDNGGSVGSSVSKSTTMLIADTNSGGKPSSKLVKAKELGTPIASMAQAKRTLGYKA